MRSAADEEALRTSQAAQSSASASSASASSAAASAAASSSSAVEALRTALPDGVYEVSTTVTASDIPIVAVGDVAAAEWTVTSSCAAEGCTSTISSSGGATYTGTFDGARLSLTGQTDYFCFDGSGSTIPGTERPDGFSLVGDLAVGPGGAVFDGTLVRTSVLAPGAVPAECAFDYVTGSTAEYATTMRLVTPVPAPAGAGTTSGAGTSAATPTS